jgi:uncharacterized protein YecE (DUF72 family)
MKTYIGCSGYHYDSWREIFYPKDLSKDKWLQFYAKHFNCVEINNTFYNNPLEKTLLDWKNKTPADFKFSVKANRYFTHMKKLKIDDDFKRRYKDFEELVLTLQDKLSCILWQLPGNIEKKLSKLSSFCDFAGKGIHHVIEFRHESWFAPEVYEILESAGMSFCMVSAPKKIPEEAITTSPVGYLRFHGKDTWYKYHYSGRELDEWKVKLEKLNIKNLFVFFNNDVDANAVKNAKMMTEKFE